MMDATGRVPISVLLIKALGRWAVWFGGLTVFGWIGLELFRTDKVWIDRPITDWLLLHRTPGLSQVMRAITEAGRAEALTGVVALGALVLAATNHRRSSLFLIVAGAGAGALNAGLKWMFARPRPDELLRAALTEGYAFPSGHSMVSAAVYGALAIIAIARFPRHRSVLVAACVVLVGAVGLSRAYLLVHYPSDVLAGWSLGISWALWIKPAILGRGFLPGRTSEADLVADGVNPAVYRRPHNS